MKKKQILQQSYFYVVFLASSMLLASCFGPKNLVSQQSGTPDYDYVGDTLNGWVLVRQDTLWGYVSADGKRVIKPTFLWAADFTNGMALVQDKRGYRYINDQGKLLRRIKAQHAYSFAEGLAPVAIKGKWGYINRKGKKVIKRQFDWAQPFHGNRAAVAVGMKRGYINRDGQLVIPASYQEARPFKNGVAIVRKDFRFGLIDTLGKFLLPNQYDHIAHWENDFYRLGVYYSVADRVNIFGLADANGKLLLDAKYSYIDLQQQQYIWVKRDSLYGLFDRQGKVIVPVAYAYLGAIWDNGLIAAKKEGNWGFLDTHGAVALPFEHQAPISAAEGRIWIRKDSAIILMDDAFRVIKRFRKYNKVYPFSNGYATVAIKDTSDYYGSLYGYVDRNGNEVVAPQYNGGAGDVNSYGISVVGKTEGHGIIDEYLFDIRKGVLVNEKRYSNLNRFGALLFNSYGDFLSAKTGKPISDFPYQHIELLEGDRKDLAAARRDGKSALIDTTLTELLPLEYDDIESFYHGRMAIKMNGRWGYADEQLRKRIPMIYEEAYYFQYRMITRVRQNKKIGIINRYGKEIIPMNYSHISFDYACDRIYAEKGEDGIDIYDRDGRLLLASDFGYVGYYGRRNYVAYRQDGKLGFMDYDFKVLYEPEFDGCGDFYDGLAWVRKNEKGGYINEQFQLVIPVQFDHFQPFVAGLAKVEKDGREYYINTQGVEVVPTEAQFAARKQEVKRRRWDVDDNFR